MVLKNLVLIHEFLLHAKRNLLQLQLHKNRINGFCVSPAAASRSEQTMEIRWNPAILNTGYNESVLYRTVFHFPLIRFALINVRIQRNLAISSSVLLRYVYIDDSIDDNHDDYYENTASDRQVNPTKVY